MLGIADSEGPNNKIAKSRKARAALVTKQIKRD